MSLTMHRSSLSPSTSKRPPASLTAFKSSPTPHHKYDLRHSKFANTTNPKSSNNTHELSAIGPSAPRSPKPKYHPYDTRGRPAVFGGHSVLCGVKESDALVPDVLLSKVGPFPYPTTPVLSTYDSTGTLLDEKGAKEAFDIAKAAHFTVQAHETVIQAKIREQILILKVLQRQAESLRSAVRDAERQVGQIAGFLHDQDTFSLKMEGDSAEELASRETPNDEESSDGLNTSPVSQRSRKGKSRE